MTDFLDHLRSGGSGLELEGRRLLVAVSGGADSVALLRGLWELRAEGRWDLVAAHLDHMLRGEDSAGDARFVEDLCQKLSIPCLLKQRDVQAEKAGTNQTLEEAARRARYDFLLSSAIAHHCTDVALAHTADDQAETILHHILRGTGLSGLRGIPRERPLSAEVRLVRPLLAVRKSEIERWLAERNQDYRRDVSNLDAAFTRNRIRNDLLPMLQKDYNPQVIPALIRLGRLAGETEDVLETFAEQFLETAILERSPRHCKLDAEALAAKPPAFRRVCFMVLWRKQDWPRQRMTFAHWNRLAELVMLKRGALSLPNGLSALCRRDWLQVELKIG